MNITTRNKRTFAVLALAVMAICAGAVTGHAASNKSTVKKATTWMNKAKMSSFASTGFRADAVSAFAAARQIGAGGKRSADDRYLKEIENDAANFALTSGATGKLILAAVAGGKNPQCFGPANEKTDLVKQLESFYSSSGKYGSTAFDQGFAMLALKAAHVRIPSAAVKHAKKSRGKHGWNFSMSTSTGDDIESTALIIEALRAAGVKKSDKALRQAYKWITNQRNATGGYNPGAAQGETQANTTAFAVRAADALGKNNTQAKRSLRALQMGNGSFRSTPADKGQYGAGIATSDVVIALSGAHYPVVKRKRAATSCG